MLVDLFVLKTPKKFREFAISEPMSNTVEDNVKVCLLTPNQSIINFLIDTQNYYNPKRRIFLTIARDIVKYQATNMLFRKNCLRD